MSTTEEHPPRFVFVHGITLEGNRGAHAEAVEQALSQAGFDVHCPDFTDGEFAACKVDEALAIIDKLAQGGKVALVYHSYGGFVSHLYASRHPDRVVACFGLAPTINVRVLLENFDAAAMDKWRETGRSSSPPKKGEPPKIVTSYPWCQSILSLPATETTPQPLCPTLLIVPTAEAGKKAPLFSSEAATLPAAALPRCMLVVEDGHNLDSTFPDVVRMLVQWARVVVDEGQDGAAARTQALYEERPSWAVDAMLADLDVASQV